MNEVQLECYPHGYACAVAIADDTDGATVANVAHVYDVLRDHGHRVTKTVWPLRPDAAGTAADRASETLEDVPYRRFCEGLAQSGFELAIAGRSVSVDPTWR